MSWAPFCPYCGNAAKLATGNIIYPGRNNLSHLKFWMCAPCSAWVGCHKEDSYIMVSGQKIVSDGTLPLGRLADSELRKAKMRAHEAFDPIWKENQYISRADAYTWLRIMMGMGKDECHIGEFDVEQCEEVVRAVLARERMFNAKQRPPANIS